MVRRFSGRSLPVDQAALAIEFTDGVNIGNERIAPLESPSDLQLQVLLRARDTNPILAAFSDVLEF